MAQQQDSNVSRPSSMAQQQTSNVDSTVDPNIHGFYAPQSPPMQPLRSQPQPPPPSPPSQKGQYHAYGSHNPPASHGQLYQYQPVMQVPQPAYPQIYRPEVPYSKNWFFFKDGLQALSVVFCVVGIALSLSLLNSTYGYLTLVMNVPVFGFALVWGLADLLVRLRRNFQRPSVHPGAHVAMSLIIWLGAAIIGGIGTTLAVVYDNYDGDTYCWSSREQDYVECGDRFNGRRDIFTTAAVFACLLWLTHFVLFVAACIDTAKHNAAVRAQVMIIPQQQVWGPPQQVWQPMPPQQYHHYQQPPPHHQQQPQMRPQPQPQREQPPSAESVPLHPRGEPIPPSPSPVHSSPRLSSAAPNETGVAR
ncbi:hypothetical protein S7711_01035 [Stachybotrys chartarum IBT 7711]|uniref:Uncharacterized protein n=1 Tax=Stachybotrys chartarum (strain CBS 109288 / IBT 7711) TaxID=1280523 RepID=A0A084B474_STACB|nr:hypothetical protein S7711_01035 [Stachybotrys chartarum IBT 7711]KFA52421.1 hypothetical protein S40293_09591 [Stachybotrys chartarum IBT 40293]KFA80311.1 hypothetical protein S40288_05883 [Stachybotrys chartarum IBT 40288]